MQARKEMELQWKDLHEDLKEVPRVGEFLRQLIAAGIDTGIKSLRISVMPDPGRMLTLLQEVAAGTVSPEEATERLAETQRIHLTQGAVHYPAGRRVVVTGGAAPAAPGFASPSGTLRGLRGRRGWVLRYHPDGMAELRGVPAGKPIPDGTPVRLEGIKNKLPLLEGKRGVVAGYQTVKEGEARVQVVVDGGLGKMAFREENVHLLVPDAELEVDTSLQASPSRACTTSRQSQVSALLH